MHTGIDRVGTGAAAADAAQDKGPGGKARAGWDISKMAPKLKDERWGCLCWLSVCVSDKM